MNNMNFKALWIKFEKFTTVERYVQKIRTSQLWVAPSL